MIAAAQRTVVIITMAGAGSRFAAVGYTVPKYEIVANGRSLFAWSMESLRSFIDAGCEFVFIARSLPNVHDFLAGDCRQLGIGKFRVITIDAITDGQATTAMIAARPLSGSAQPVAIYNIDTYVDPLAMDIAAIRGAGWIPCFPGDGDKWSFAAADESGRVSEVREKKRISPHATVGLYWFDSVERFIDVYDRYYSNPENLEAREKYIAPLYNLLIQDGAPVYIHEIRADQVCPLGTPEDVHVFEKRSDHASVSAGVP
jgi:dTDP-glucose pyrophosphorylase